MNEDLVVLVTGAGGLIGSAIVRALLSHGARVILVDVDEEKIAQVALGVDETKILQLVGNAGAVGDIDRCIKESVASFGRIDAAIHCAYPRSKGWGARFEEVNPSDLIEDLSAQLGGAILFSQRILTFFEKQGHGNLIHVASIMGVVMPRFEVYEGTNIMSPLEYTAIKAGVIAMTAYLAKYYKRKKIRVNCISPGGVLDQQPNEFIERYRAHCSDKGMLDPEDLVGSVLYLVSKQSQYLTGQNIVLDDGWSL